MVLDQLLADSFAESIGFTPPPRALRLLLHRTPEVNAIKESRANRELSDEVVRSFVARLLAHLTPGDRLPHELALAALAVALENEGGALASHYISDLSSLNIPEIAVAIHVARQCLSLATLRADTQTRIVDLGQGFAPPPQTFVTTPNSTLRGTRPILFVGDYCDAV